MDYARTGTVASDLARSGRYEQLSNPALTGMPRVDLDRLVDGLSIRHAAVVERRRHQRRGGARLPGTFGGVFRQKITDAERILATILHLRQVCTMQALADLFDVSRRTIGNALAEVRPLLEEDGFRLPPAPSRLHSAADLLASIAPQDDAPTNPKPPR